MCLHRDFFEIVQFGVCEFLETVSLGLLPKMGVLSQYFFKYFSYITLFPLFWDARDVNVASFGMVLQVPETLYPFFLFYIG